MSDYSTIYKNNDAKSMLDWRDKDADPYFNLVRDANQIKFLHDHKNLKKKLTIIDYGCAFGDTLALLRALNPEHDLYGVEIVKEIADVAEKRIGKGRIFKKSCEKELALPDKSADLICSFDMIEHVPFTKKREGAAGKKNNTEKTIVGNDKISGFFAECNRLLKKDGLAVIVTPNCNWMMKLIYRLTGNSYLVDPAFHPNQYTAARMKKEAREYLKVVRIERGYDLNIITRALSWFGIYKHICLVAKKK